MVKDTEIDNVFDNNNKALNLTRWSVGTSFGAFLTKSALAITNLSFSKDAFPNFINQLSKYIGPLATNNPNFWRWQLIDYAFGIITAGLGYLTVNLLISKFLPSFKFKTQAAVIFAVLATLLASVAGEIYGSITAFKGSPIDIADWTAEMGGMVTFLTVEWLYSQISVRGLSLSKLLFKKEDVIPSRLRQLVEKGLLYLSTGGVLLVLYYSVLYLLKLFGWV